MRNVWSLICTTANNDDVRKLSWFKDHRKQIVNKRKRVSHITCCPWWCGGTRFLKALTESRLLQCSYRQYAKNKCLSFHPSSLMMWGNSASSKIRERRQKPHRHLTENKKGTLAQFTYILNLWTNQCAVYSTLRPWWCDEFQILQSSPNADWTLIVTSPNIKKETLTEFSYL